MANEIWSDRPDLSSPGRKRNGLFILYTHCNEIQFDSAEIMYC